MFTLDSVRDAAKVLRASRVDFFTGKLFNDVREDGDAPAGIARMYDDLAFLEVHHGADPFANATDGGDDAIADDEEVPECRIGRDGVVWRRVSEGQSPFVRVSLTDGMYALVTIAGTEPPAVGALVGLLSRVWSSVSVPLREHGETRAEWRTAREPTIQLTHEQHTDSAFAVAYDRTAKNIYDHAVQRLAVANEKAFKSAILRRTRAAVARWCKSNDMPVPRSENETASERRRRDEQETARNATPTTVAE